MAEQVTRRPSPEAAVLCGALAVGAMIRLWLFAARPSLWIDEARVALNLGTRSYAGLLQPLDYDQAAPPLFLWLAKLCVALGGMNEYALRAVPFLAGLVIPVLVFALADRLAGRRVAVIAAVLAALSPGLIRHTAEFKPYQTDALLAAGLLLSHVVARRQSGAGLDPRTGLAGALAVWASTPAVFVLAAIVAVELGSEQGRRRAALARTIPVVALWTLSFGAVYGLVYRSVADNAYLRDFWRPNLPALGNADWPSTLWLSIRDVLADAFVTGALELPAGRFTQAALLGGAVVLLVLSLWGVRWLGKGGRDAAALVTCPWLIALGAALAGVYPFAPRLTLFALPFLLVAISAGLVALYRTPWPIRLGLTACFGAIFAAGLLWCIDRVAAPRRDHHTRAAIEFFRDSVRAGEPVYVSAGTLPAWAFYTTDWRRPDSTRLHRLAREASSGGLAFENAPPRGRPVDGDGSHLAFEFGRWVELYGVFSGARWLSNGTLSRPEVDANWSRSEAERVRMAALRAVPPTAWVLTDRNLGLDAQLHAALRQAAGRTGPAYYTDGDITIARYRFDPASIR
ncbi:MAG TPA: glycosyltransferase family 39 protein [Gemmatimonadales bacterium]|nr:glycosyltransferase family 39 protein [Gemmatimonadales bacterium]